VRLKEGSKEDGFDDTRDVPVAANEVVRLDFITAAPPK